MQCEFCGADLPGHTTISITSLNTHAKPTQYAVWDCCKECEPQIYLSIVLLAKHAHKEAKAL